MLLFPCLVYLCLQCVGVLAQTCSPGSYSSGGSCVLAPAGTYVPNGGAAATTTCVSSTHAGAATCQTTQAFVSTVAGRPTSPGWYDGIGTNAYFTTPIGITQDSHGAIFLTDAGGHLIRKLNTNSVVTTLAGSYATSGLVNGQGTNAAFSSPAGIAVDSNLMLYVADTGNQRIRKVSTDGTVATLTFGSMAFQYQGLALDSSGNIYATENGHVVSFITQNPSVTRSVLAGSGSPSFSDGSGASAAFNLPNGIALSTLGVAPVLYVTDYNNYAVRAITTSGVVSTYAGAGTVSGYVDGARTSARFDKVSGVAVDPLGMVYIGDQGNRVIRMIYAIGMVITVAGPGSTGAAGYVDGFGTDVAFTQMAFFAVASTGKVYFTDPYSNNVVRLLNMAGNCPAGSYFTGVACMWVPAGYYKPVEALKDNYYMCDVGTYSTGAATTCTTCSYATGLGSSSCVAPTALPTAAPTAEPTRPTVAPTLPPTVWPSRQPTVKPSRVPTTEPTASPTASPTVQCPPGSYVSGSTCVLAPTGKFTNNYAATSLTNCSVAKFSGAAYCMPTSAYSFPVAGSSSGTVQNGCGTNVYFNAVAGVAVDTLGVVYVADNGGQVISMISTSNCVTVLAGMYGSTGANNGMGTNARFDYPAGIVVDANRNIWVADVSSSSIKVMTTSGSVSQFLNVPGTSFRGITIASSGTFFCTEITQRVTSVSSGGTRLVLAGSGVSGYSDGTGTTARFDTLQGIALSSDGTTLFVVDQLNQLIRTVTTSGSPGGGVVTTYAGSWGAVGLVDGAASSAVFNYPIGIAMLKGTVFVGDRDNNAIRMISSSGFVTTVAGNPLGGSQDGGFGTNAVFNHPGFLALSSDGKLYIADASNHAVKMLDLTGFCGGGYYGTALGVATCGAVPAGYFKPRAAFSDAYYLCPAGTYSQGGASACTACSGGATSSQFGATSCLAPTTTPSVAPTVAPSLAPTVAPTLAPTTAPTVSPTLAPTSNPTRSPSASPTAIPVVPPTATPSTGPTVAPSIAPTRAPTSTPTPAPTSAPTLYCPAGSYYTAGSCVIVPIGHVTTSYSETETSNCTSSLSTGAATCQTTDAYVSLLFGGGSGPGLYDGTGTGVHVSSPRGVAVDSIGNIYSSEVGGHVIRILRTNGVVSIFAGSYGNAGFSDGVGTSGVLFNHPQGMVVSSNLNVYVADNTNTAIRVIAPNGTTTTLLQVPNMRFYGLAFSPSGLLYASENNYHIIATITTSGSIGMTIIAGTGVSGYSNGAGTTTAALKCPAGLAITAAGTVYFGDSCNHVIRKVNSAGVVSLYAGTPQTSGFVDGALTSSKFYNPTGVALDTLAHAFVSDNNNHVIRMINNKGMVSTVGGNNLAGALADGFGTNTGIMNPIFIAMDTSNRLYFADGNDNVIRVLDIAGACPAGKYAISPGSVASCAASPAGYYKPRAEFSDNYYLCSPGTYSVSGSSSCSLCSGSTSFGATSCSTTSVPTHTPITSPTASPTVSPTPAPTVSPTAAPSSEPTNPTPAPSLGCAPGTYQLSGGSCTYAPVGKYASSSGAAVNCSSSLYAGAAICQSTEAVMSILADGDFISPWGAAVDSVGNVYVTDGSQVAVFKINIATKSVKVFAGTLQGTGYVDDIGTNAEFGALTGVTVDKALNVFVADYGNSALRMITRNGNVSTLMTGSLYRGIAVATNGIIYATINFHVESIADSITGYAPTIVAGAATYGYIDGVTGAARFTSLMGLAVTSTTSLAVYVADYGNNVIRRILGMSVTTWAGSSSGLAGHGDGLATLATFNGPVGLAVDSLGNVYVADRGNAAVRMISPSRVVSTVVGSMTGNLGVIDGFGTNAKLMTPNGVAVTSTGLLAVVDTSAQDVRLVDTTGWCEAGSYNSVPGSYVNCTLAPAGYFKPSAGFSDNYYICPRYTYSTGGASSCSPCSSALTAGSTYCTTLPTAYPTPTPSFTTAPTVAPTASPTTAVPSSPVTCFAGGYIAGGTCKLAPAGKYTTSGSATVPSDCSSSVLEGAATCRTTLAYSRMFSTSFNAPTGITVDSLGTIYVADSSSSVIWKMDPDNGSTEVVAGAIGSGVVIDGLGTNARLMMPFGLTVDSSLILYVVDYTAFNVRKISAAGQVSTLAAASDIVNLSVDEISSIELQGIAVASTGDLFITASSYVLRLSTSSSSPVVFSVFSGRDVDYRDGPATSARFGYLQGVAITSAGVVFVADVQNESIRRLSAINATAVVTTYAGCVNCINVDGYAPNVMFKQPHGLAVDSIGNLFVADNWFPAVRMIDTNQIVTFLTGYSAPSGDFVPGFGTAASLISAYGMAWASSGKLYVTSVNNGTVQIVDTTGYCPAGKFVSNDQSSCISAPAGYYKPPESFTDNYYLCPAGTYSTGGASACSPCSSSSSPRATYCATAPTARPSAVPSLKPTSLPTAVAAPTAQPTKTPIVSPTVKPSTSPSSAPTTAPSSRPSAAPTPSPSEAPTSQPISCMPGAYISGGACVLAPAGKYTVSTTAMIPSVCSSAVHPGSARCQVTQAYASQFVDNQNGLLGPWGVAVDSVGVVYYADQLTCTIYRMDPSSNIGGAGAMMAGTGLCGGTTSGDQGSSTTTSTTTTTTMSPPSGDGGSGAGKSGGVATVLNNPMGIAVDSAINVFAVNNGNSELVKVNDSGVWSLATTDSVTGLSKIDSGTLVLRAVAVDVNGTLHVTAQTLVLTLRSGSHVLSVLTGNLTSGSKDGVASVATFANLQGIAVTTAGVIYVADNRSQKVRRISGGNHTTAYVMNYAGGGPAGVVEGAATSVHFESVIGIAVDTVGNVFVSDQSGPRILKIATNKLVSVIVGGVPGDSVFLAGFGTATWFPGAYGLAMSSDSVLYVTDYDWGSVAKVTLSGYCTAGSYDQQVANASCVGAPAGYYKPAEPLTDNYYLCPAGTYSAGGAAVCEECFGSTIIGATACVTPPPSEAPTTSPTQKKPPTAFPTTAPSARPSSQPTSQPSSHPSSQPSGQPTGQPAASCLPGTISKNGACVRVVTGTYNPNYGSKSWSTCSSSAVPGAATCRSTDAFLSTAAGGSPVSGWLDGFGTQVYFKYPAGVAVDSLGNVYAADMYGFTIRMINASGTVTTLAGSYENANMANGQGTAAAFNSPTGLDIDSNRVLYVADTSNNCIRKVTSSGMVSTLASIGVGFWDVSVTSSGTVYASSLVEVIYRFSATGDSLAFIGSSGAVGSADGVGTSVTMHGPVGLTHLTDNNFYFVDYGNNLIRQFSAVDGTTTTLAGAAGQSGFADGSGTNARFNLPYGICATAGRLFVSDAANNAIRLVTVSGSVSTIAGGSSSGFANGFGTNGLLVTPRDIAINSAGILYIADSGNLRIRALDTAGYCPAGYFNTVPGSITGCVQAPAGYYKPRIPFSDNYYMCPANQAAPAGSSSCKQCSYATPFGSGGCLDPTAQPSMQPSAVPTVLPSGHPKANPTQQPTRLPTTSYPTVLFTLSPSCAPTEYPTSLPSSTMPTTAPTSLPTTSSPSPVPTTSPTILSTTTPTTIPTTMAPTVLPTTTPTTISPTMPPSTTPSTVLTWAPETSPTASPSTGSPSVNPSSMPTSVPPTVVPSAAATIVPSTAATPAPTVLSPTMDPTVAPSILSTLSPSLSSSTSATESPSTSISAMPTSTPIVNPTKVPSMIPTVPPSSLPTVFPTSSGVITPTSLPTPIPTVAPTVAPTVLPSVTLTALPSVMPTSLPSATPTAVPSVPVMAVTMSLTSKSVFSSVMTQGLATLLMSTSPALSLTLRVITSLNGAEVASVVFPSNITLSPVSATTWSLDYVGLAIPGNYTLSVALSGPSAADYVSLPSNGLVFTVLNSGATPSAPSLLSAQFAGDGSSVVVAFDAATDVGGITSSSFSCSQLLQFAGASQASCRWSSDATKIIFTSASTMMLNVSSTISVLPGKIRVHCPTSFSSAVCRMWSTAVAKTVLLQAPSVLQVPSVQLVMPAVVGLCDSLVVDFLGSTGSGGRAWGSVAILLISTSSTNASALQSLQSLLATKSASGAARVSVPRTLLDTGASYSIEVTVCNFLGACGHATAVADVVDSSIPSVSFIGGNTYSVAVNSSLKVAASAYVSSCGGGQSRLNLQYSWSIAIVTTSGNSVLASMQSAAKDPSKFILAPYQLTALSSYIVQLTVMDTVSLLSSSATASVSVPRSSLAAIIEGGSKQSVRLLQAFTVDGSNSFDPDQASAIIIGVDFKWSCLQALPSFVTSCPFVLNSTTLAQSMLEGFVGVAAANATALIDLLLFDSSRSSTAQVWLAVVSTASPMVTIQSVFASPLSNSGALVLKGSVVAPAGCNSLWTVSDSSLDLSTASLVAPRSSVAGGTVATNVYLSLMANSLPVASTLVFSLTCSDSTNPSLVAAASVTLTTNSPPSPGHFLVTPSSGYGFATKFAMEATYWSDTDIPLSYEFGFISSSSVASVGSVVQSKSASTSTQTYLSAGLASANFSLSTTLQVFDSLGSSVSVARVLQVFPVQMNATEVNQRTATLLAEVGSDVDGLKQVISVVAATVSAVDCSLAPNCTLLNRLKCSTVANTCGACISSLFVGSTGASNDMCVPVSAVDSVITSVWASSKQCPSSCSGNGDCEYFNPSSRKSLTECTASNANCVAECVCFDGFNGADCSLTNDQLLVVQATTAQLLSSLVKVNNMESLDPQSALFRSAALLSLTENVALLTKETLLLVSNISLGLLSDSSIVLSTDTVNSLSAVVDNVAVASVAYPDLSEVVSILLNALIDVISAQMVPGQMSQTSLQASYRLSASFIAESGNLSVTVPQSALEMFTGTAFSSVDVEAVAGSMVNVLSLSKYLITNSSGFGNSSITSNAMRLSTNWDNANCADSSVIFTFVHYQTETFGFSTDNTTIRYAQCVRGTRETVHATCPGNYTVSIYCNGSSTHTVATACPRPHYKPSCAISTGIGSSYTCTVLNFTSTTTTCSCSSCTFSAPSDSARRRLVGASTYGAVVVALSEYSFLEFATVMESAADFDAGSLRSTALISSSFGVMWIGALLVVLGVEYGRRRRETRSRAKVVQSAPQGPAGDRHKVQDGNATSKATAVVPRQGRRKSSVTALSLEQLKYDSFEVCLKDYIYELFSPAFSEDSETVRLVRELWNKHEYFSVFQQEFGTDQWIAVFSLLTNLNANFFLLALFYDVQFASDDGTCGLLNTESSCLSKMSMFNPGKTTCEWQASVVTSSGYECAWRQPTFDIFSTLVVFVIVLITSVPITFTVSCICEMVLMAPALVDVETQESNKKLRRQSAMMMMNQAQQDQGQGKPKTGIRMSDIEALTAANTRSNTSVNNKSTKSGRPTVFSQVAELDEKMRRVSSIAHRLSAKQLQLQDSSFSSTGTASISQMSQLSKAIQRKRDKENEHFKSFFAMLRELRKFADSLPTMRQLKGRPRRNRDRRSAESPEQKPELDERTRELILEFWRVWGPFLKNDDQGDDLSDDEGKSDRLDSRNRRKKRAGASNNRGLRRRLNSGNSNADDEQDEQDEPDSDGDASDASDNHSVNSSQSSRSNRSRQGRVGNNDSSAAQFAASGELNKVVNESLNWIKVLQSKPPEQAGVQILELFVRDCMGQHSRAAIIFSQKVHPLRHKYILTWSIKCITFVALLLLNLYFVFACMLYGQDKGLGWQKGWLFTCIVNVFVDIFINSVTVAAVMHFFVPNLIVNQARNIKNVVTDIVHDLCSVSSSNIKTGAVTSNAPPAGAGANADAKDGDDSRLQVGRPLARDKSSPAAKQVTNPSPTHRVFSAADYFFVSTHVARAFPDLLESKIVLAYKSFFLSKEQMHIINPSMKKLFSQSGSSGTQRRLRSQSQLLDGFNSSRFTYATKALASLSLWLTTLLFVFGSQSLLGQELIINMFNPGLVTAIAYIGLAIWNNSYFGMLVAVVVVVIGFVLVYLAIHKMLKRSGRRLMSNQHGNLAAIAVTASSTNVKHLEAAAVTATAASATVDRNMTADDMERTERRVKTVDPVRVRDAKEAVSNNVSNNENDKNQAQSEAEGEEQSVLLHSMQRLDEVRGRSMMSLDFDEDVEAIGSGRSRVTSFGHTFAMDPLAPLSARSRAISYDDETPRDNVEIRTINRLPALAHPADFEWDKESDDHETVTPQQQVPFGGRRRLDTDDSSPRYDTEDTEASFPDQDQYRRIQAIVRRQSDFSDFYEMEHNEDEASDDESCHHDDYITGLEQVLDLEARSRTTSGHTVVLSTGALGEETPAVRFVSFDDNEQESQSSDTSQV